MIVTLLVEQESAVLRHVDERPPAMLRGEFKKMLAFVVRHEIVPIIDRTFALADGNAAIARMDAGEQFGKIILAIG